MAGIVSGAEGRRSMALGSGARCAESAAGAAGYQRPLVFTLQRFRSVDLIGRYLRGTHAPM